MEESIKLHSMALVGPVRDDDVDSVQEAIAKKGSYGRALDILFEAQDCWFAMDAFRRDRERCKRYNYGDQWGDPVTVNGCTMSEEEYLRRQGRVPLKNNLIRRLVKNVVGVYRSQSKEPTCKTRDRAEQKYGETMSTVLQCNMQANRMNELLSRQMEEFLISGLVVMRKWYGNRGGKTDCWTDCVQPANFFIDSHMRDFRGTDCSIVGEVHDVSFSALASQFAHNEEDYKTLSQIYRTARDVRSFGHAWQEFGQNRAPYGAFLFCPDQALCRVVEVWKKETRPRLRCHDYNTGEIFKCEESDRKVLVDDINEKRREIGLARGMEEDDIPYIKAEWFVDEYWYYYYLTPFGDVLAEGETPYKHGSHPYVFKAYPFIDGEIHSFVADIIDQQRYTNRLIMLQDMIMQSSAKGVLMLPADCIPEGMSVQDFAESWVEYNGVIVYEPSKTRGAAPQQVSANSTNIGINELLGLQLRMFEDISGVQGALQGKQGFSGTSAAMYNMQTQNATMSLLDILESFSEFVCEGAVKDVKNIQQFYDAQRVEEISGKDEELFPGAAERVLNLDYDLSIVQSTSTPAYRMLANDMLLQLMQAGQINVQQLLEAGDFPFADKLLQSIQAQQQQQQAQQAQMMQQQGQMPQGGGEAPEQSLPPELMAQLAAQQGGAEQGGEPPLPPELMAQLAAQRGEQMPPQAEQMPESGASQEEMEETEDPEEGGDYDDAADATLPIRHPSSAPQGNAGNGGLPMWRG